MVSKWGVGEWAKCVHTKPKFYKKKNKIIKFEWQRPVSMTPGVKQI